MADKSFGVKQLDVLGTGTPTISAPNILNLDCHTVAISTSITIGENLTVSGIVTATTFSGSGANLTNLPTIAGIWTVTNNSASNYVISGPGGLSSANNPDLYLERGKTYQFAMNASSHGFGIQTSSGTWNQSNEYTTGITNPRADTGTITFAVPYNAPARLYYACTSGHSGMVGNLYIQGETNQTYFAYDSQGHLAKQDNYDTNGGKSYWYDASATNGGTNQAYIDGQSGDIMAKGNFVVGTAGKGIDFSATSDASGMSSELLDDYEEGSFTPTLQMDGGGASLGYNFNIGRYTKIGNNVHVELDILINAVNSNGSGSYLKLNGLPFTSLNGATFGGLHCPYYHNMNNTPIRGALIERNDSWAYLYHQFESGTGNIQNATVANSFTTTSRFILVGSYTVP